MLVLTVFKLPGAAHAVGSCTGTTSHFGSSASDATWCGSALQTAIEGYVDLGNFSTYLSATNDCSSKLSLISTTNWNSYKEVYRGALGSYLPTGSSTAWTTTSNSNNVNYLDTTGSSSNTSTPNAACRTVLPTIILDQSKLCVVGGSGTIDNPYLMAENEACGTTTLTPDAGASDYCKVTGVTDTMQNWTGCSGLATPTGTNFTQGPCLTDERDGKVYQIRKFADGNCWMVENLRYGGATADSGSATDYCASRTSFSGNGSSSPNASWYAAADGKGTALHLYGDCRDPAATGGSGTVAAPCLNSTTCGYLYNWQAAVQNADAYYNGVATPATAGTQGICPTGWHVPTGYGSSPDEFSALDSAVGGSGSYGSSAYPFWNPGGSFSGVYSGECGSSGSLGGQGDGGVVWSSTPSGSSYAYYLYFGSGGVYPGDGSYGSRSYGYAVRCVRN